MLFAIAPLVGLAAASSCSYVAGNWYCAETSQVTYSGLGGVGGSYQRVTDMDPDSCTCTKATQAFSGALSPLDEDLSVHFRGPVTLKQFAVYALQQPASRLKRRQVADPQARYTLIKPISYVSTKTASAAQTTQGAVTTTSAATQTTNPAALITTSTTAAATAASPTYTSAATGSSWQRTSYYSAASGSADNLVFLNNMGGVAGSGTWSPCFGNSLSYASSSGVGAASSPQVLADVTIPPNTEYSIFSGQACTQESCGYVAPGVPAYRGFAGADKLFLMEFGMPTDTTAAGTAGGFNADMPAIWLLNAQIPRAQQYGGCSCWATGCGELDLFEALNSGSMNLTTTLHTTLGGGGGSADYFARPVTGTIKAAVVFAAATKQISVLILPQAASFDAAIAMEGVEAWQASAGAATTVAITA